MKLSENGLALIRKHEGFRAVAYRDGGGILTIGYGSTHGVTEGMTITPEQADDMLVAEVKDDEACVNGAVTVPLTQNEFDALVDFVYNLGCHAFRGSTLLRKLNESDYDGAAKEILKWNHDNGVVIAGLTARRKDEQELFESA